METPILVSSISVNFSKGGSLRIMDYQKKLKLERVVHTCPRTRAYPQGIAPQAHF